eukprot:scaffold157558_cov35-Tisochrysis_lutea.AAC.6
MPATLRGSHLEQLRLRHSPVVKHRGRVGDKLAHAFAPLGAREAKLVCLPSVIQVQTCVGQAVENKRPAVPEHRLEPAIIRGRID